MRTALVVEGGAMRSIFSAGVLDTFLENCFDPFSFYIGTSGGATNLCSHLAGMYRRNYKVLTQYSTTSNFINFGRFIKGGHGVDIDWLWNAASRDMPVNLDNLFKNNREIYFVMTSVDSGRACYIRANKKNMELYSKATCALPVFYRGGVTIEGKTYSDGGMSDPIPVRKAYDLGARKIMVIRTRPASYRMKTSLVNQFVFSSLNKEPQLNNALKRRPDNYNSSIEFINNPPHDAEIIQITPDETFKTTRMTRDAKILEKDYHMGIDLGKTAIEMWG